MIKSIFLPGQPPEDDEDTEEGCVEPGEGGEECPAIARFRHVELVGNEACHGGDERPQAADIGAEHEAGVIVRKA